MLIRSTGGVVAVAAAAAVLTYIGLGLKSEGSAMIFLGLGL